MDSYEKILFDSYVKNTTYNNLELIISPHCNLKCKYCYMKKYNQLDKSPVMSKETIDQAIQLFSKFKTNQNFVIELFGGEVFLQPQLIEYILQKVENNEQILSVMIPTNGYYPHLVEKFLNTYSKLYVSLSVDGIYNEEVNRPKHSSHPEEIDYNFLFSIYKKYPTRSGFHPMIFAETVENTYKTFQWFVENMNNPTEVENTLYLLPVRNPENWTENKINILIQELNQCRQYCINNNITMEKTKFNIFQQPNCQRGTTCTLQTSLMVDWYGDLYPCHRLMYPEFKFGNVFTYPHWEFNLILPFYIYHRNNNLVCNSCEINNKNNCMGGCLGAQYEYWGDPFIPIPDICQLNQKINAEVLND